MSVELSASVINGRFQLLPRPIAAPGKCAVCGAVDRAVMDFGFDLDFYGVVYLCVDCVKEAAQVMLLTLGLDDEQKQIVPLYLDQEAINEYVRTSLDNIQRLSVILKQYTPVVEIPQGTDNAVQGDEPDELVSDPVLPEFDEQEPDVVIDEGPTELSTSPSDGSVPKFEF